MLWWSFSCPNVSERFDGQDYNEIFAHVAKMEAVRTLLMQQPRNGNSVRWM